MNRQWSRIEEIAQEIALCPPRGRSWHRRAYIDWDLIEKLRAALKARGFNWEAAYTKEKTS